MVDFQCKSRYDYEDFLTVMRLLRGPGGCPWDAEQTHQSIRRNFLEETYEVIDALDKDSAPDMCEELGDVLMQVVFHAIMEEERGRFTMADVVDGVTKKMIFRHPHVFGGGMTADTSEQVLTNWEVLKREEKGQASTADAIEAVPIRCLPCGGQRRSRKRPPRRDSTGPVPWPRWTSWKRKSGSCAPPWSAAAVRTSPTASGRSWGTRCSWPPRWARCAPWTRRTPFTAPATNLTAASAMWSSTPKRP